MGAYVHDKRNDYHFSSDIHDVIKRLQSKLEKYNIIVKADKGNTVVILDRNRYISILIKWTILLLADSRKFEEVKEETILNRLTKFQSFVNHKHKKGVFTDAEYKKLYPSSSGIPVLYSLPKIHKKGIPMRPIFSMIGTLNHGHAKWIGDQLKARG